MNTKQTDTEYNPAPPSKEYLQVLEKAAWSCAKAIIFYRHNYTEEELQKIKPQIRNFLLATTDPFKNYLEFCQRLLLARKHITNDQLASPANWFSPACNNGFYQTGRAYKALLKQRENHPLCRKEWKALAQAILEMHETPEISVFTYWEKWFLLNKNYEELRTFLFFISHDTNFI